MPDLNEAATPESAIYEGSSSRFDAHYELYEPLGISSPQHHPGSFSRSSSYSSTGPQTPESQPALSEAYFNALDGESTLASSYAPQAAELQAFSLFDFSLDDLGTFGQALGEKADFSAKMTGTVEIGGYSHSPVVEGFSGYAAGGAPSNEVSQEGSADHTNAAGHTCAIDPREPVAEPTGGIPGSDDATEGFLVDLNWLFGDSGHEDSIDEDMDYTDAATPVPVDAAFSQPGDHLSHEVQLHRTPSSASLPSLVAGSSRSVSSSSSGSSMISILECGPSEDRSMESEQMLAASSRPSWSDGLTEGWRTGEKLDGVSDTKDDWGLGTLFS